MSETESTGTPKRVKSTVWIDQGTLDRLRVEADLQDRSVNNLIMRYVATGLAQDEENRQAAEQAQAHRAARARVAARQEAARRGQEGQQ